MGVRCENVIVELSATDGNAFAILGRVTRELRSCGVSDEDIKEFQDQATSGDYDHLLQVVFDWVNVV